MKRLFAVSGWAMHGLSVTTVTGRWLAKSAAEAEAMCRAHWNDTNPNRPIGALYVSDITEEARTALTQIDQEKALANDAL